MNYLRSIFLLLTVLVTTGAAGQAQYEATPASTIEAIARGEAREALIAMEAKGSEAEKNAVSSSFPQR